MEPPDTAKIATAYREAGTAVVARTLGLRVAWTTIQRADGSAGHTELDDWWEDAEPTNDIVSYRTNLAMVALAGRESVATLTEVGTTTPRADSDIGADDAALERRVHSLIVDEQSVRDEINAVAAALLQEGWLDSVRLDEVRRAARDQGDAHPAETPVVGRRKLRRARGARRRPRRIGARFGH